MTALTKDADHKDEALNLEEALKLTGIGKYNYAILLISCFSLLAAAAELFSVGIVVAAAQCDLRLDVYKKGLIGSLPMLGVVASAHLWGYIADTRGRKFCLTVTMSGTVFFAIISSFANHWILLALAKFFAAAAASGTNAVIYAILGEKTPATHRSRFLMYVATGVMLSATVNALLAYPILHLSFEYRIPIFGYSYRPWRLLTETYGLLSGVSLILLRLFVLESPKYYFAKGNDIDGLNVLRKMYAINSGKAGEHYPVKCVVVEETVVASEKDQSIFKSMWDQTIPLFKREHIKKTLLVCYLSIVVYSVGPPIIIWLPAILDAYSRNLGSENNFCEIIQKTKTEITNATVVTTVEPVCVDTIADFTLLSLVGFSLYMTFTTAVSVLLMKLTGRKWMFCGIHVTSTILGITINYVYNIGGMAMLLGITTSVLCMGVLTTYVVDMFPTYFRAMAMCLTMMIGRAFSFIVITIMGAQLENNCTNFMYIFSAFIFSGALVSLFLPGKKKPDSTEKIAESKNKRGEAYLCFLLFAVKTPWFQNIFLYFCPAINLLSTVRNTNI